MTGRDIAINVLLYQLAWFAAVLGMAAGKTWVCLAGVMVAVAWHLARARAPLREVQLIGVATVLGATFESLLVYTGWVSIDARLLLGGVLPVGMVALWAAFATTLNVSMRRLRRHALLGAVLAGLGTPLAYAAGARLGALHWVLAAPALVLIALGWAAIMPLLLRSALRFDGYATP
jgi:Protein of unknown function (DUF2878)